MLGFVLSSPVPVLNIRVIEMSGHAVTPKANNRQSSLEAVFSRQKQHFRPPSAYKVQEDSETDFFSRLKLYIKYIFK